MENIELETLDLSGKKLKKLCKPTTNEAQVVTLILDDNELQRLDNIDSFTKVQKLSAVRNGLLRMYGVCRLHLLHTLNLAHNGILTIEGLKELTNLKCLCLAGNNIKTIEHLNTNVNLEHIDLSENCITHIADLSFLKNLRELLLHNNKIGHLRQCERYLPTTLVTLTLAYNNLTDLNEISQLVHLINLYSISIADNPCVNMSGGNVPGFDYRPFILNWCMSVKIIDGYSVDAIESLKAEWLYSQGRGRHFRVGDQQELRQYLANICPLTAETLETEEDRKLRLILSKAKHHQQQLRDQESGSECSPSLSRKKSGLRNSPRLNSSRLSNRTKSPDRMSSSCYMTSSIVNSPLMSQSLDPTLLSHSISKSETTINSEHHQNGVLEKCLEDINSPLQALSKLVPVPESLMSPDYRPSPLINRITTPTAPIVNLPTRVSSTKSIQPVRSPKPSRIATVRAKSASESRRNVHSPIPQRRKSPARIQTNKKSEKITNNANTLKKSPSSEEDSEMCSAKLQTIQMKAEERRQQKDVESHSNSSGDDKVENAAIFIQKMWRGYHTRNKNKYVQELFKNLQTQRAEEYIQKLATDMESTKVALESERRIQMLQMQAINALWKKVSTIQPDGDTSGMSALNSTVTFDNNEIVKDLAHTCTMLHSQIQELQGSMQGIVRFMSALGQMPVINQHLKDNDNAIATQTEISAVHTPQGEAAKMFPFQKQMRPSSLPLPVSQRGKQGNSTNSGNQELKQYAGSLVDGVIRTVSETKGDLPSATDETEILETAAIELENSILTNEQENLND